MFCIHYDNDDILRKGGNFIFTKESIYLSGEVWQQGRRRNNQDSITVQEIVTRKGVMLLAAVCDGMGGHEEGETASGFVTEQLVAWLYAEVLRLMQEGKGRGMWRRSWYRCFYGINRKLNLYAEKKGIFTGTTATMLFLYQRRYYLFHVGDSRAYRIRGSLPVFVGIKQLTRDHIHKAHVLSRCIGAGRCDMPAYKTGRVRKGDGFLLCSDGLYGHISDKELAESLRPRQIREERQIKRILRELSDRAYARGENDNISAVYIAVMR